MASSLEQLTADPGCNTKYLTPSVLHLSTSLVRKDTEKSKLLKLARFTIYGACTITFSRSITTP